MLGECYGKGSLQRQSCCTVVCSPQTRPSIAFSAMRYQKPYVTFSSNAISRIKFGWIFLSGLNLLRLCHQGPRRTYFILVGFLEEESVKRSWCVLFGSYGKPEMSSYLNRISFQKISLWQKLV
ncbi:hypothetical protein ACS0TY_008016 [Phlomoides rotata]